LWKIIINNICESYDNLFNGISPHAMYTVKPLMTSGNIPKKLYLYQRSKPLTNWDNWLDSSRDLLKYLILILDEYEKTPSIFVKLMCTIEYEIFYLVRFFLEEESKYTKLNKDSEKNYYYQCSIIVGIYFKFLSLVHKNTHLPSTYENLKYPLLIFLNTIISHEIKWNNFTSSNYTNFDFYDLKEFSNLSYCREDSDIFLYVMKSIADRDYLFFNPVSVILRDIFDETTFSAVSKTISNYVSANEMNMTNAIVDSRVLFIVTSILFLAFGIHGFKINKKIEQEKNVFSIESTPIDYSYIVNDLHKIPHAGSGSNSNHLDLVSRLINSSLEVSFFAPYLISRTLINKDYPYENPNPINLRYYQIFQVKM